MEPEDLIKLSGKELYRTIVEMSEDDAKTCLAFAIGYIHREL